MNIENEIINNKENLTIKYASKLLERLEILLKNSKAESDIDKFVLLKTAACDLAFACELLIKSKLSRYGNDSLYKPWESHNLMACYDKLKQEDKTLLENKMLEKNYNMIDVLSNENTSLAYEKRYLYEENTGIPNYKFLCHFANALLELENEDTYNLEIIDTLSDNFDYTVFDKNNILEKHTAKIFEKANIYDIDNNFDGEERYIIKNMKTSDYALFSELIFKKFSNGRNCRSHELSELHKRLEDACKFLITKEDYTYRYIVDNKNINFYWTFDSLLSGEEFDVGDRLRDIYADLDDAFKKSRYATTEFYDKYDEVYNFAQRIKIINDLLLGNCTEVNTIMTNKKILMEKFGYHFMEINSFTAEEIKNINIDYLMFLKSCIDNNFDYAVPKKILLETDKNIINKIKYFILNYPDERIPIAIDYLVEKKDNSYILDQYKYNISIKLQESGISQTRENIDKYISLIEQFNKCGLGKDLTNYILSGKILISMIKINDLDKINLYIKYLFNLYYLDYDINKFHFDFLSKIYLEDINKINKLRKIFKNNNQEELFYQQIGYILEISEEQIYKTLDIINKNKIPISYYKDPNLFKTDLNEFLQFINEINLSDKIMLDAKLIITNKTNLKKYNSIDMKKIYKILYENNLLFLYKYEGIMTANVNVIDDSGLLNELMSYDLIKNINNSRYNDRDRDGVSTLVYNMFNYKEIKDNLLDLLTKKIVIDNPYILDKLNTSSGLENNIYKINIYNTWYEKIENNNIFINGGAYNLTAELKSELKNILLKAIENPNYTMLEPLSERIKIIFSNKELLKNIDEDILNKYSISLMQKIVTVSKFKTADFSNIKYFKNLFRVIYENNLNVDKMLDLLNLLYDFGNRGIVMPFVTELLTLNSDGNEFDILGNRHNFNDDFIEYLINNINGKNIFEVADFIKNINIVPKEHDEEINMLKI
jgi:hypothetical protein